MVFTAESSLQPSLKSLYQTQLGETSETKAVAILTLWLTEAQARALVLPFCMAVTVLSGGFRRMWNYKYYYK